MANEQETPSLSAQLMRPRYLAIAICLILTGAGIRLGWNQLKSKLADSPEYRLSVETVKLKPHTPPPWIRDDIKRQVFSNSGIGDSMTLLDEPGQVQQRLVDAFELHPWVRSVKRVDLIGPGNVEVELEYREPIAVLQITSEGSRKLLPIDADAVRLPEGDLSAVEMAYLPRIQGIDERPPIGAAWSDQRMRGAIELASELRKVWESCSLLEIVPSKYPEVLRTHRFYVYDLLASGGTTIRWGAAPGSAPPGESPVAEKLARLTKYVREHGRLDTIDSPKVIDVRSTLRIEARIAKQSDDVEVR